MTGAALTTDRGARAPAPRMDAGHRAAGAAVVRRSHGRLAQRLDADSPWAISLQEWRKVAVRAWAKANRDNIGLISAGVSFYCFLAIVPLLGAIVMSYGLIADVGIVVENINALATVMPAEAAELIGKQLLNVVTTSADKKGLGLLVALSISLYGGMNAASAIVMALNIAFEEAERRRFFALTLRALIMTLLGIAGAVTAIIAVAAMGHLDWLMSGLPEPLLLLIKLLGYALLTSIGAAATATLYRYGPNRDHARWIWLTPGSVLTGCLWISVGLGFGAYVAHFGNYDATYGSLGAVVVLLTWIYLSSYVLLLGAELNAELERQTAEDTTGGPPQPIGHRGATRADTVADDDDASPAAELAEAPPGITPPAAPRRWMGKELVASRIASRVGGVVGMQRIDFTQSLLVTGGLIMLRRQGRAGLGIALLASGGCLAWLTRDKRQAEPET